MYIIHTVNVAADANCVILVAICESVLSVCVTSLNILCCSSEHWSRRQKAGSAPFSREKDYSAPARLLQLVCEQKRVATLCINNTSLRV